MHRSTKFLLAFAFVIAGSFVTVSEADAGGFRRARGGGLFFNRYRRPVRSTPVYRQSYGTPQSYYRSRSTSRRSWPGAIGTMDPRYEFFQDVNGYWK